MEENKLANVLSFYPFIVKTAIVLSLATIFFNFVVPDFGQIKTKLAKSFKSEQGKLYMLSFIQNPMALYKASQVAEREGRIDSAIRQMELAIGLLEMHSADKGVLGRYYSRLEGLQAFVKKK